MKIVEDAPGTRLMLEGSTATPVPPVAVGCLGLVILFLFFMPVLMLGLAFAQQDWIARAAYACFALMTLGAVSLGLVALWRASQQTTLLDVNGSAGEARVGTSGWFRSKTRVEILPLARLRSASLRRAPAASSRIGAASAWNLAVELRSRREGEESQLDTQAFTLAVDGLDKHEEVADFALRLGAAAGLPFVRVVRNDARDVEIELARDYQSGMSPVPAIPNKAQYAKDVVAPAARTVVAQERVASFDPAGFRSTHRVETWTPGVLVRLHKPLDGAAFGCLPFALLVFAGPVLVALGERAALVREFASPVVIGLLGLLVGLVALLAVYGAMPRTVDVDWGARTVSMRAPGSATVIPFEQLTAVELRAVHRAHRSKNSTSHHYFCEIGVQFRDASKGALASETLVRTETSTSDPDSPYRMAMPLATELAKALGIERKFFDYT